MASVNLTGTLTNPEGEPDEGAIVKFTLLTTTGTTVSSSKSQLEVPQDGLYDIDIVYGNLRVDYINEDGTTRFVAIVTVNGDTVATSLPELLNAAVPPTDAQLLEFQGILADAVTAQVAAEAAETGAVAAEATLLAEKITTVQLIALSNTFAVGSVIDTLGYTSNGDGGGAQWVKSGISGSTPSQSPAQKGGAVLSDGSGDVWALVGSEISVVGLGGVLDGVTDNTSVTAAAVAWGGKLKIPVGVYLTDSFTILSTTLHVEGDSEQSTTIKLKNNAVNNVFTLTGTAKLKLHNLTIDQNFANNSGGHGIRSGGCDSLILNNVTIQNCAFYGIGFQAGTSKGVFLTDLTIKNTNSDGIDIKDYNSNNECIFITNYRAENVSIIDADDVALDVRGEVCVNGVSIQTATNSRGIRLRQGGSQGRGGFGTISNVVFKGHGSGSTIAIQIATDSRDFTFNNIVAKDCLQAVLQDSGAVGGVINNVSSSGIYGDGMSIGGSDLLVTNYSAINTTGSSRLCDVESSCVNFSLSNFFIDVAVNVQGIRIISGATGTALSNGTIRNGTVGDSAIDSIINNVRLI